SDSRHQVHRRSRAAGVQTKSHSARTFRLLEETSLRLQASPRRNSRSPVVSERKFSSIDRATKSHRPPDIADPKTRKVGNRPRPSRQTNRPRQTAADKIHLRTKALTLVAHFATKWGS